MNAVLAPQPPTSHELARERAIALLRRNLTPQGMLAASRTQQAEARRYTRIFGRDAAICILAMTGSGDPLLEQGAIASLDALAAQQAGNGQIAKYVDPEGAGADFWYVGCIDATLWWLIAVDHVRSAGQVEPERWAVQIDKALAWLHAQEHPHFRLLQQNEASDWADIMPRSGFVLYTNALWVEVKQRYGLEQAEATRQHFGDLFDPFTPQLPSYPRARLMRHYARRGQTHDGLLLSFVNLSVCGMEGDVFGNILAVLSGAVDEQAGIRILETIHAASASDPYPVRVVLRPLDKGHKLWRAYMGRHKQNLPHQYHNGGIWPFVGGFWVVALARLGLADLARQELERLIAMNDEDDWRFTEWFHGQSLARGGMPGQSWNAAALLLALDAVEKLERPPRRPAAKVAVVA
ncbi:glycoside hydrolase 100 family protein [Ramlibacter rhizophilus]|uniref:beta-fructofuranosidase n=1 Tax=Ramlibacter rhizophilus TaxID=1781167 RepID=A0A4Z0BYQ8_9BURK|nr:glycoside hydrolase 100 family protein [Ramlibacter rhizophilus]TFZ04383.1 glycoside hydrolase [Ramlibacter rhizophilus]